MEITQADLRIGDYGTLSSSCDSFQDDQYEIQASEDNDTHDECFILDVRESISGESSEQDNNSNYITVSSLNVEPNLNSIQHLEADIINIKQESLYEDSLNSETLDEDIANRLSKAHQVLIKNGDDLENLNISNVVISDDILEQLSFGIKKEKTCLDENWRIKEEVDLEEATIICKVESNTKTRNIISKTGKFRTQEEREKLRKTAQWSRERRKKLYAKESEEQRRERLAKEAASKRAMRTRERLDAEAARRREYRMYNETPDEKRKRLDRDAERRRVKRRAMYANVTPEQRRNEAEAARKREYRMYNETPDERRKRLDRDAERRRVKRLTMYANETPEQRRERLNKESAKRREARLNQYAKETEEQRQERLRKDALRAREMRFTRSAIETEEERRQRLVKDALRKRELRMHGAPSVNSHFTELQTVRNFEELNNVQIKDDHDNQLGGQYLSNWMMWFQNTLTQPTNSGDKSENHQQNF